MADRRFDAVVEGLVEAKAPGVAVAVLRNGEFIHCKAYGLADLEWGVALRPECSFRIASLTKQFTAAAIMRLAEQGALSIDDPLERYLPTFDPRGRRVSPRHLLNHTSGIRDHDQGQTRRADRTIISREQLLEEIIERPFDFEPGHRYAYNNSGYNLLGAVIEAASGLDYETLLKREFFEPLGMARTGLCTAEAIIPMRARGYVRGRRGFHNARPDPVNWSYAAGGLCSTLDDLAIWDRVLREGRVLRPESFAQMIQPTPLADGTTYPYGVGWGTAAYEGRRLHHHTGGVSGFACQMARLTDEALTIIVLSNLYLFPFDRVTRGLLRVAMDLPPIEAKGGLAKAEDFAPCAGRFAGERGAEFLFGPEQTDLSRHLYLGEGRFLDPLDHEVELRFSELLDGRYRVVSYLSPLWPEQRFERRDD